ncbi:hypothetical protein OG474_09900 [Kribbella sp. NBC_01505]|uniref:hypothetical protein n=1 Tax=Kribbella sp. NBC_01505 TaxID=2903580 RepID=UPI00386602FC
MRVVTSYRTAFLLEAAEGFRVRVQAYGPGGVLWVREVVADWSIENRWPTVTLNGFAMDEGDAVSESVASHVAHAARSEDHWVISQIPASIKSAMWAAGMALPPKSEF